MTGYRTLLRLALKNRLALFRVGTWSKGDGKPDGKQIAVGVAYAVLAVMVLGGVIAMEWLLFEGLKIVGQVWLLPGLALMLSMVGMILMGMFQVLTRLYFAKDTALMAYLPVRSETVLTAKLTEIYLGEVGVNACILLPAITLCGLRTGAGLGYWLTGLAVTLLTPMIPLAILLLLTTFLARVSGLARHKEAIVMVCSLVMVIVILALEMGVVTRIPDDADAMFFLRLIMDREALIDQTIGAVPPVKWALDALRGDGSRLALLTGVSVAAMGLAMSLVAPKYLTIALSQQERGTKRKAVRVKHQAASSPMLALYKLEWRTLLRTPAYAFNGLYGALIFPLVTVYMIVISGFSEDMSGLMKLISVFAGDIPMTDQALILAGVAGFCGIINPAAATAVSREGKRFAHSRMLPVKPETMLAAKLLMGLTVSMITGATMTGVFVVFFTKNVLVLAGGVVLMAMLSIAGAAVSLGWDASHPLLDWPNETYAIKQNNNVAVGMVAGLLILALPVGAALMLLRAAPGIRLACVVGVIALETAGALMFLKKSAVKMAAWEKGL